jgi:hypothetical protein
MTRQNGQRWQRWLCAVALVGLSSGSVTSREHASMTALERQRLVAHLEMTRDWLIDEIADLSAAQLAFRPAEGEWSVAEVVDHVLVVAPIYWQDLQRALEAPPRAERGTNTDADVLWYGIDRTNRETAIAPERPQGRVRDAKGAVTEYRTHHERLLRYVRTTNDDLRAHRVSRQASDAYQWVLLISTHEQRHILQIREIKRRPGFPAK